MLYLKINKNKNENVVLNFFNNLQKLAKYLFKKQKQKTENEQTNKTCLSPFYDAVKVQHFKSNLSN